MIDDEDVEYIRKAKMLWDVISRPGYAHDDDGLAALMSAGTLRYAIQGRVFVDEAFASRNFRMGETL